MNLLLLTGAGTSAELGVPAMRAMAAQFVDHLRDIDLQKELIDKIELLISKSGHDMEHAIDVIDKIEAGALARQEMGETVEDEEIVPYRTLREEAEWFVQHCCEQIDLPAAIAMWSPTLRASNGINLTIASTNYDRAIEIAASRLKTPLDDGFAGFAGSERASWRGFIEGQGLSLLKLHGSTDWYHGNGFETFKLRHPMPLYGALELVSKDAANLPLHSALVLPSREKKVTHPPFPQISAEFRNRASAADVAIFIGSSLRDPHIRDVCAGCAPKKPTFVVSLNPQFENGLLPEEAKVINQSSGQFLISTFPHFLHEKEIDVLERASTSAELPLSDVLRWITTACASSAPTRERCAAIEKLADTRVALPKIEVLSLLGSDDPDVKLYALGLVPASPNGGELLSFARSSIPSEDDNEFREELALLEQMVAGAETSP